LLLRLLGGLEGKELRINTFMLECLIESVNFDVGHEEHISSMFVYYGRFNDNVKKTHIACHHDTSNLLNGHKIPMNTNQLNNCHLHSNLNK
jgi:hypothetical protein